MRISQRVIKHAESIGASIAVELDGRTGAIYVWFKHDGNVDVCELGVSAATMLTMLDRLTRR